MVKIYKLKRWILKRSSILPINLNIVMITQWFWKIIPLLLRKSNTGKIFQWFKKRRPNIVRKAWYCQNNAMILEKVQRYLFSRKSFDLWTRIHLRIAHERGVKPSASRELYLPEMQGVQYGPYPVQERMHPDQYGRHPCPPRLSWGTVRKRWRGGHRRIGHVADVLYDSYFSCCDCSA